MKNVMIEAEQVRDPHEKDYLAHRSKWNWKYGMHSISQNIYLNYYFLKSFTSILQYQSFTMFRFLKIFVIAIYKKFWCDSKKWRSIWIQQEKIHKNQSSKSKKTWHNLNFKSLCYRRNYNGEIKFSIQHIQCDKCTHSFKQYFSIL